MKTNQFYRRLLNLLNIKLFELGNEEANLQAFLFLFFFRILDLLNNLATNCDINMVVNVSAFSSSTSTYGRVHLVAQGYDALCR